MELRVLRYFMTIAREGSITSAANVLHVTQPTLSRQIRDLENELGQKLFIRGSHHMTLTAEGMVLRKRAEEILSMVDKNRSRISRDGKYGQRKIFISAAEKPRRFSILQKLQRRYGKTIPASIIICTAETRKT